MCDVTKDNFYSLLPLIKKSIEEASFIGKKLLLLNFLNFWILFCKFMIITYTYLHITSKYIDSLRKENLNRGEETKQYKKYNIRLSSNAWLNYPEQIQWTTFFLLQGSKFGDIPTSSLILYKQNASFCTNKM